MLFARKSFCMILQKFHITTKVGFIFKNSKSEPIFMQYLTFIEYFGRLFCFVCSNILENG